MSTSSTMPDTQNLADTDLKQKFLKGMSFSACTVTVVTTDGPAGRFGVTVSANASVSADGVRPTLLICVHHLSRAANAIIANGAFCVNVLKDDQCHISDIFAGRIKPKDGDKFACASWTKGATGLPHVSDGLVAFDCRLLSEQRIGTHYIFIGEVEDVSTAAAGMPLLYANRAYGTPAALPAGQ